MAVMSLNGASKFVPKPWGWENFIYADGEYNLIVKTVFVKGGHATEISCLADVDIVLSCTSGHMAVEWFTKKPATSAEYSINLRTVECRPGAALLIAEDTYYRIVAIEDTYVYVTSGYVDEDQMHLFAELDSDFFLPSSPE